MGYSQHASHCRLHTDPKKIESRIFNALWEMRKRGLKDSTIDFTRKDLFFIAKHSDINNPESVRGFIATLDRKEGYKRNLCFAYDNYVKTYEMSWIKPEYYVPNKLLKIPLESKIKMLIANASGKLALAISISKDTGMRPIELMNLTAKDVDLQKGLVYPATAKHGNARILKLRKSTLNLLSSYLARHNVGLNEKVFGTWKSSTYGKWFRHYRNKLAQKLSDPSIKSIRLYDLRHFYATMLYNKTRDILHVKQQMEHRKIETTLIYTQLISFENDDYHVKTAATLDEAKQLLEAGFEYVTDMQDVKLFRKRK